jgi:hypothetical protein
MMLMAQPFWPALLPAAALISEKQNLLQWQNEIWRVKYRLLVSGWENDRKPGSPSTNRWSAAREAF